MFFGFYMFFAPEYAMFLLHILGVLYMYSVPKSYTF